MVNIHTTVVITLIKEQEGQKWADLKANVGIVAKMVSR